jgi:hypothetical protein
VSNVEQLSCRQRSIFSGSFVMNPRKLIYLLFTWGWRVPATLAFLILWISKADCNTAGAHGYLHSRRRATNGPATWASLSCHPSRLAVAHLNLKLSRLS